MGWYPCSALPSRVSVEVAATLVHKRRRFKIGVSGGGGGVNGTEIKFREREKKWKDLIIIKAALIFRSQQNLAGVTRVFL